MVQWGVKSVVCAAWMRVSVLRGWDKASKTSGLWAHVGPDGPIHWSRVLWGGLLCPVGGSPVWWVPCVGGPLCCPSPGSYFWFGFNQVSFKKTLPNFHQYVSCPTRRDKILNLCYGSIKNTYKSVSPPPRWAQRIITVCIYCQFIKVF